MSYHDKVFWALGAFCLGIITASICSEKQLQPAVVLGVLFLLATAAIIIRMSAIGAVLLLILFGAAYYFVDAHRYQQHFSAPLNQEETFEGVIENIDDKYEYQRATLRLEAPYRGTIIFNVSEYSTLAYGDKVRLSGTLNPIEGEARRYFEKEGVHAALKSPKNITVLAKKQGSKIKTVLFAFRDYIQKTITRNLESPESNFVTGLLIGKSGGFSKEFLDQMRQTGTTHLIALSGYNVTILATTIMEALILFLSRKKAFYGALMSMGLFVVMTGGQASVVRAAIMAGIALYAGQSSRMYKPRNAIMITATGMALYNPKTLVFDVGFQLSFLALLGILYVKPALEKQFKLSQESGIFSWRENLITTTAAQIAVLPVILSVFGFFSFIAFVTNVLILTLTPYTMLYGVVIVSAKSISGYLSALIATLGKPLASYQIWVIQFFSKHSLGVTVADIPFLVVFLYYVLLFIALVLIERKARHE